MSGGRQTGSNPAIDSYTSLSLFPENGVLSNLTSEPIGADDPALLEGNDSEAGAAADEMSKAFLVELQKSAAQAGGLASA